MYDFFSGYPRLRLYKDLILQRLAGGADARRQDLQEWVQRWQDDAEAGRNILQNIWKTIENGCQNEKLTVTQI